MVMLAVLIIALPSKGDRMYLNCAQFKPKRPIFLSQIKLTKHQNLMIKSIDFLFYFGIYLIVNIKFKVR